MKKCLLCDIEMKFVKSNTFIDSAITHKGDGFGIPDRESSIHSKIFVCPNCGLIQQFVPEDELKYLENF